MIDGNAAQRASLAGLIHFAATALSSLIQLALLTHYLPKELAGLWALALTLANYLLFFDFGIGPTLTREISFRIGGRTEPPTSDLAKARDIFATGSRITTLLSIVAILIGVTLGKTIFIKACPPEHLEDIEIAWFLFVVAVGMNLKSTTFFAALEGSGVIGVAKLTRASVVVVSLFITFIGLSLAPGSLAIGWTYAIQGAFLLFFSYFQFRRKTLLWGAGTVQMSLAKDLAKPSMQWTLTSIGALLLFHTSNLIIASRLSITDVVRFDSIMRAGQAFLIFSLTPALATVAIQSALHARDQPAYLTSMVMSNCKHALTSMAILTSSFAIFHETIIRMWLGDSYVPRPLIVYVLMAMFVLETNHFALASSVMSTGHLRFYMPALLGGALNLVLALWLVSPLGLVGVAISLFFSQFLTNNWYVTAVSLNTLRIPFRRYARNVLSPTLFVLAVSIGVNLILRHFSSHWSPWAQVAAVLLLAGLLLLTTTFRPYAGQAKY